MVRKYVRPGSAFTNSSTPRSRKQVWISRCATTGISACIDPWGRILERTQYNEQAVLTCDIGARNPEQPHTFYTRFGGLMEVMIQFINIFVLAYAGLVMK
jgi:apolipoprotein N-acyltransferase